LAVTTAAGDAGGSAAAPAATATAVTRQLRIGRVRDIDRTIGRDAPERIPESEMRGRSVAGRRGANEGGFG
jgi:hypothetical protein